MNLKYYPEVIDGAKIISCDCPTINFLNQTDKTQVVSLRGVPFVLRPNDSMNFPKTGISPNVTVNESFEIVVFNAPTAGHQGKFIVTKGYIS